MCCCKKLHSCDLPAGFGPLVLAADYLRGDPVECLVTKLLSRGDTVSIEQGRLIIQPASGKPVPMEWLIESTPDICRSILKASGLDAFEYIGYHTGHYGKHKAPGVTLQFVSVVTGEAAYAIFNVDLTRQRTTAKGVAGTALPKGQFRVGERSHFYKFWQSTGIPMPKRLAAFHDYMGNLKGIMYTGTALDGRLQAGNISPLRVSTKHVYNAIMPDNCHTTAGQLPDKRQTKQPDKESTPSQTVQGFQPFSTARVSNHGKTVISKQGNKVSPINPLPPRKPPQDQSVDEWLADYESA
jgi:hypothetical protein